MNYGSQTIDYALRNGMINEIADSDEYAGGSQPEYTRKRSVKALRKRTRRRTATTPSCGMGARCNRRFAW